MILKGGVEVHFRNPDYARIVRMIAGAGTTGVALDAICERLNPLGWTVKHRSVASMRTSARVRIFYINRDILRPLGFEISARTSYAPYALRKYSNA